MQRKISVNNLITKLKSETKQEISVILHNSICMLQNIYESENYLKNDPFTFICDEQITANIESEMLAFEESSELNRVEIEESEKKIEEFEGQMEKNRNEGLFFKNLGEKALADKEKKTKEKVEKIKEVNTENSGSGKTRKNVYLFFIGLLSFGIVDSFASSSGAADWKRVSVLGGVLVVLFSLFINEQNKDNQKD